MHTRKDCSHSAHRSHSTTLSGTLAGLLLCLSLLSFPAHSEISRGELLSMPCLGCHSLDNSASAPIPPLTDLSVPYLSYTLKTFKNGERPNTIMQRIASGYTDAELRLIAETLGSKKEAQ